ncbi:hypothetical protein [Clostridium sp. CF012]|uniref:hypothetical protein n=1 Tax=Clostridium sp. CF012 TaxID=2843319 RepID=UPI001C0E535D|nr:hypothetical protein [Clostridium sp. CF012]MBU3145570.1 hypothetical protein [Clostridium sp. CF012]
MGNYNTQYQSYYNNLAKKQRGTNNFASESMGQSRIWNFYIKRLTRELTGVLILFIFVIFCKVVVNTTTQSAYNYTKEAINKKYDYSTLIVKAKGFKVKDIEIITVNFIEKIKSTISSEYEVTDKNIGL